MEKGKRIELANSEIPLPEAVIHHIQSFLKAKQAAQTSILSKSWRNAWLTRPNLAFDERDFQNPLNRDPKSRVSLSFSEFARNTLERYEKSNLKIESFKLYLDFKESKNKSLADELITKALKIGVFNLDLKFRLRDSLVLSSEYEHRYKHVAQLSVTACGIDGPLDASVSCSRHKPLQLSPQYVVFDLVMYMVSENQFIEKLFSYECGCLAEAKKTTRLKTLEIKRNRRGSSMFYY